MSLRRSKPLDYEVLSYYFEEVVEEEESRDSRVNKPVTEWCKCGNCMEMAIDVECLCCTEIDTIKCFHLGGREW